MAHRALSPSEAYRLLEPGPVLLVTTQLKDRPNVMTLSWQTPMEFTPPLVGFVMSGVHHSFEALRKTKECVLNVPQADLLPAVVGCGNASGAEVDKFARFGLTPLPSKAVAPPRIRECFPHLECRVRDGRLVNAYNFFILEILRAWIDPKVSSPRTLHHAGYGLFRVAGETLRTRSKAK